LITFIMALLVLNLSVTSLAERVFFRRVSRQDMAYRGVENFLIGSLMGVTVLIGAVSVALAAIYFPPHFRGWGEVTAEQKVVGWAVNRSRPSERVEVQLFVDGRFVANMVADLPRPDVAAAGKADDERCGYSFRIPALEAGEHVAHVYAMHKVGEGTFRTLQLTGKPLRFTVGEDGRVSASAR